MSTVQKAQYWGAVVVGILAGVAAIVAAVHFQQVAYAAWGGVFILGTAIAVWSGAKASLSGSLEPPTIEAWFKRIKDGPMYVIFGLALVAVVITLIFRPF